MIEDAMIGVVCLNPALDVTHHVAAVNWSGVNRPDGVYARPGGKGLNVARTLHALGAEVLVMGLAGGSTGEAVTTGLAALAVPAAFTPVPGETRRTFTVVDGRTGHTAAFNEPGPVIAAEAYAEFRDQYASALARCAAVVLSGSLPPGLAPGSYAELTAMAAAAGVPVLLDAHGDALRLGAAAGPAIVKPNLAELEMFAGRPLSVGPAVAAAAAELRAAGPQAVVVSLGPGGLYADTGDGCWQTVPPAVVAGNATGPATRQPRAWPTGWPGGSRGTSGSGTRSRSAPRPPRPRWPGSSIRRTTPRCWRRPW